MTIITKLPMFFALGMIIAAPAAAQKPDWSQKGDYYAPDKTIMQQQTPQELKQIRNGDYYPPERTIVQQPTTQELKQDSEGDYYVPQKGN